jgi:hypothetical protein
MGTVNEHISGWEAAGLIDPETAARLRAADEADAAGAVATIPERASPSASAMFGPPVTIAEVFGYLGAFFLLAAATVAVGVAAGLGNVVVGFVVAGIGLGLGRDDPRRGRAAGVAFVLAASYLGIGAGMLAEEAGLGWPASGVVGSGVALAAAVAFRWRHPAVLSQFAVLGALTCLATALLSVLDRTLFGSFDATAGGPPAIVKVALSAAWWLVIGVGLGLLGLWEAGRAAEDPGAGRRAALTRFWAGLTAVTGLASALYTTGDVSNGWERVLEPLVADGLVIALSLFLIERAFRRDAMAFAYAGAIGLIIALTDLNVSYLGEREEIALFVEGLLLVGIGVAANRLRGRIGRGAPPTSPAAPPPDAAAVEA